jgi:hypothetical protein
MAVELSTCQKGCELVLTPLIQLERPGGSYNRERTASRHYLFGHRTVALGREATNRVWSQVSALQIYRSSIKQTLKIQSVKARIGQKEAFA